MEKCFVELALLTINLLQECIMTQGQRNIIWEIVFRSIVGDPETASNELLIEAINRANATVERIDALFESDIRSAR